MKHLGRSITFAVIGFLLFASAAQFVEHLYYRVMPGDYFLDYYYVKVSDATVGDAVPLTLCRHTHFEEFRLDATRTFIYILDGKRSQTVAEYTLHPTIEHTNSPCQSLQIPVNRQPQRAGTYQLHVTGSFTVNGYRKTISYTSNEYSLSDTQQSLQTRLQQLTDQITQIQAQLQQLAQPTSTHTVIVEPTQTTTTTSPPKSSTRSPQSSVKH